MRRMVVAGLAVVLVAATVPGTVGSTVPDNEPPLVDAGLDQRVSEGTRIQLDGAATRDPDGTVVAYAWTIEAPNGTTMTPACETCVRTWFTATDPGVYAVTLSARDDDGARRTDTLYVTVTGTNASEPPSVTLTAPDETVAGTGTRLTADISKGSADLEHIDWQVDGVGLVSSGLAPSDRSETLRHAFTTTGRKQVTVTVVDAENRTATATATVTVTPASSGPPPGGGGGGGGGGNRLRIEIDGPRYVTPGTGAKYTARIAKHDESGESTVDHFEFTWSNVDGNTGMAPHEAYREFDAEPGTKVTIRVHGTEKLTNHDDVAKLEVYVVNKSESDGVTWETNAREPRPRISAPDVVTACSPQTLQLSANDATSHTGVEHDAATSYEYEWSNVDDSTDRWAEKTVAAGSAESQQIEVGVKIKKVYNKERFEQPVVLSSTSTKKVKIKCSEINHYTEYHWTKAGETRRVNATTAPTDDAEVVRKTGTETSWVSGTKEYVDESERPSYIPGPDVVLRNKKTSKTTTTESKYAISRPGSEWERTEKNARKLSEREGTVWKESKTSAPDGYEKWTLVDKEVREERCHGGISVCTNTYYKYSYVDETWLHEWSKTTTTTTTVYVYQKQETTTWYLWEYTTGTQEMTTTYDPRERNVSIVGEVVAHRHECDGDSSESACDAENRSDVASAEGQPRTELADTSLHRSRK